jgi:hypothetical protein
MEKQNIEGRQWLVHLEKAREIIAKQVKKNEGGNR